MSSASSAAGPAMPAKATAPPASPPTTAPPAGPSDAASPEPAARSRRSRSGLWPLLVRVHFYAGVFVAPFLVTAALTGLLFTLTPTLDGYVYHAYLHPARVEGAQLPLVEQVAAARLVHPEGTIAAVAPADGPDATTRVVLSVPELGEKQRTVYVDPYSGRVRGALVTWFGETPLMTWFDDLHRNLHLGVLGRHYSELAASWLWVLVLGGLALWLGRPRTYRGTRRPRRALLPDRAAGGVRKTRSWHAVTGLWLAVGLLALSATGLTWSRYAGANFTAVLDDLQAHAPEIDATLPGEAPAPADPAAPPGEHAEHAPGTAGAAGLPAGIDVDGVVAAAREAGLDGPIEVSPPAEAGTGWVATQVDNRWPVRKDQAAIDPASGEVVAVNRWAAYPLLAKLSNLGVQAHMGLLFGPPNQLVLAMIAVGLLAGIFWGYRMWWQRRPIRADRRARFGRPPARGAWRAVPLAVLLPGVVVVVAVGWALPMLGLSLLAFLLLDAVTGGLARRRRDRSAGPRTPSPSAT